MVQAKKRNMDRANGLLILVSQINHRRMRDYGIEIITKYNEYMSPGQETVCAEAAE